MSSGVCTHAQKRKKGRGRENKMRRERQKGKGEGGGGGEHGTGEKRIDKNELEWSLQYGYSSYSSAYPTRTKIVTCSMVEAELEKTVFFIVKSV